MLQRIIYIILFVALTKSVFAQTYVDGFISGTSVWTEAESPYVISDDMTIQREATLIIEAGTEILIADDRLISVKGSLICEGVPGKPVEISAKSNYWGGIYIDRTAKEVRIKFTDFYSGGRNSYTQNSVILINEALVFIEYSKFINSYSYGITSFRDGYADMGGGLLNSRGYNTFTGFSHNRWAIVNKSKIVLDAANNCWNDEPSLIIYDNARNDAVGKVNYDPVSVNCEPQKPNKAKLIFPADSSKDIPVFFNLKWHKLTDVSYYKLQFSDEVEFSNSKLDIELPDSIYTVNNLKYGERYFWRVRGVNYAGNGNWSDTYTFVTYDTAKPEKAILNYPPDNSQLECKVIFEWEELEKTDMYHLLITNVENSIDTLIPTNYLVLNEFANNDVLKWKVRGKNRNGYGKWSEERTFKIMDKFFAGEELIYNRENLINVINTEFGTELVFSDSSETIVYNITENEASIYNYPVDYFCKAFLNTNNEYDYIYSNNSKLNFILDDSLHYEINTSGKITKIKTADLNNNGINELTCKTLSNNTEYLEIYELKDENFVRYGESISLSAESDFFIMDMDIDGDNDIIILDKNMIRSYINHDGAFILSDNVVYISNANNAFLWDMNLDGYIDLILNEENGILLVSNNNGFLEKDSLILNTDYKLRNITDLNNSGKISFLVSDNKQNIYEFDYSNKKFNSLSIISGNIDLINNNSDNKPDILADNIIFINNVCTKEPILSNPVNLRYSFFDGNSIMLEWDRSKLNSINNYNVTYEISLTNNDNNNAFKLKTKNNFYLIENPDDAEYDWQVRAVYNDLIYTDYVIYKGLYTKNALPKPPKSWNFSNKTGLNTTILLREKDRVNIEGLNVDYGDALGIFFIRDTSLVCGGYSYFNSKKVILTAWGDNLQTSEIKDGFNYTEVFRFKYWDASEQIEFPVNVVFDRGIGWFKPDTLAEIKSISPPDTAFIIIDENKWNYISSGLVPFNPFFSKFKELQNKTVIDIENNIFDDENDELIFWNTGKGYKVFSDRMDTVTIFGSRIAAEYHPFNMKRNQWYLLPSIINDTTHADSALKSIYQHIILLKDEEGRVISPKYGIKQFDYLFPNKSYEIILSEDSEFILHNKKVAITDTLNDNNNLKLSNKIIQNSGNNATLMVVFDDYLPGEIAVFANETIIGNAAVESDTIIIPVKGADITGNITGAGEGDELNIVYSIDEGNIYQIPIYNIYNELNKQYESIYRYSQNSFYSIEIGIDEVLSIKDDIDSPFDIYPNPASDYIEIYTSITENNCNREEADINEIEIYNVLWKKVLSHNIQPISKLHRIDVASLPKGVYFVKIGKRVEKFVKN
jgi:hypothetical protein